VRPSIRVRRDGQALYLDRRIVDLLNAAWAHGIATRSSLIPAASSVAHVTFETTDDAARFLDLVTAPDDPALPETWTVTAKVKNESGGGERTARHLRITVGIPAASLPHVTRTARAKTPPTT
jgi:hypothetical protein